jgi:hypothetical protein
VYFVVSANATVHYKARYYFWILVTSMNLGNHCHPDTSYQKSRSARFYQCRHSYALGHFWQLLHQVVILSISGILCDFDNSCTELSFFSFPAYFVILAILAQVVIFLISGILCDFCKHYCPRSLITRPCIRLMYIIYIIYLIIIYNPFSFHPKFPDD